MENLVWVKSRRCESSWCVEVAKTPDGRVLVRNSMAPGDVLTFTVEEWRAFVGGVRDGDFAFAAR